MEKLIFATGNQNKVREIRTLLEGNNDFDIVSLQDMDILDDIPETGNTLEENARQKARYINKNYGLNCFSEDTGLEIDALEGAPGVYSARYAGPAKNNQANMDLVLKNLADKMNRKARFKTVICLILGDKEFLFEGIIEGLILDQPRGNMGFGYDPIFLPEGSARSFAEMDKSEKSKISHRGKAMQKLIDFLQGTN